MGLQVVLLERGPALGGALLAAATVHPENEPYLDWLVAEVTQVGVEVRTGVTADPGTIAALAPDVVVLATGGAVVVPEIGGAGQSQVSRGLDPSSIPAGRRVAVIGARMAAVEYAELLAGQGKLVALLHTGDEIAPEFGAKRRAEHMDRLDRLGVTVHVGATIEAITAGAVRWTPVHGTPRDLPADAVVLAGEVVADPAAGSFVAALAAVVPAHVTIHQVGDVTGLGLIRGATAEAARLVASLP